jgi:hypothetical protein
MNEDDAVKAIKILPIDGYFWVEKDGKIYDPSFKEEKRILDTFGCVYEKHYKKASDLVQKVYISMLLKGYENLTNISSQEETNKFIKKWKYEFGKGCINIYVLWKRIGGNIVFGSMGYRKKQSSSIHWEYGGDNYETVVDYRIKI